MKPLGFPHLRHLFLFLTLNFGTLYICCLSAAVAIFFQNKEIKFQFLFFQIFSRSTKTIQKNLNSNYMEKLNLVREAEGIFQIIIDKIKKIGEKIDEDIFSEDINENFKEISNYIPKLQTLISEILSGLDCGELKPAEVEKLIAFSGIVIDAFEKLENKLRIFADADAKRIEFLTRIYNQIKSAMSYSSKGKSIKKKT